MKKNDMLPVIAAFVIALLVVPIAAVPVNALTPSAYPGIASVVTIPEDDLKRNTGVMVLGLDPTDYENDLSPSVNPREPWYTDSLCQGTPVAEGVVVGPEVTSEPIYIPAYTTYYQQVLGGQCVAHKFAPRWVSLQKGYGEGMELLSQHKILATLNGVPTKPDYFLCEIVEKEKAKIPPMTTKTPSKRQFDDELIKTTVKDVSSNFVCKVHWLKPGVGALDVYFVGPRVKNFIADHMLIITMGWTVGRTTIWATDLQDICILGWSMDDNVLGIRLFDNPGKSTWTGGWEYYFSWPDTLHLFVSCDEAAAWQLAWITGGWPYATN